MLVWDIIMFLCYSLIPMINIIVLYKDKMYFEVLNMTREHSRMVRNSWPSTSTGERLN